MIKEKYTLSLVSVSVPLSLALTLLNMKIKRTISCTNSFDGFSIKYNIMHKHEDIERIPSVQYAFAYNLESEQIYFKDMVIYNKIYL